MINRLAEHIHKNAIQKGFFEDPKNIGEMLCLIHSEVSEAMEADRKDKYSICGTLKKHLEEGRDFKEGFETHVKGTFEDELADVIIRVLDLCAFKNIDIEWHINQKIAYNTTRPHKHGKKY